MEDKKRPNRALQLLAQLVPRKVLEQARDMSLREEREDRIRRFTGKNILFLAVSCLGIMLVSGLMVRMLAWMLPQDMPWAKQLLLPVGLAVWFGAVLAYMNRLLRLQRMAALGEVVLAKDVSLTRLQE